MSTAPVPPKAPRQVWPWIVGLILAPFVVLGATVASVIHLNRDAAVLRDEVMSAAGGGWQTRVQLTANPIVLGLARAGITQIPSLPEEARRALRVVRSASVGVFEHGERGSIEARGRLVQDADAAMSRRGWTRVVGVRDDGNTVLIYLPEGRGDATPSRVCLAVCDGRHLVVVSASIRCDALADLVAYAAQAHGGIRL